MTKLYIENSLALIYQQSLINNLKIDISIFTIVKGTYRILFTSVKTYLCCLIIILFFLTNPLSASLVVASKANVENLVNVKSHYSTDTIKKSESDEFIKELEEDKFKGGRTARWYYGWVLFKEYPWYKKIYGGGFDYMEKYGKQFSEAKYDWPHNPMISAFLYSGIIGGIAFIWFMVMVFVNYLLYLKRHVFFFVSFLVTFFFVFFSDTSLFNTPLFTFLCIIPFFTKYLCLKEEYLDSQKIPFKRILFW